MIYIGIPSRSFFVRVTTFYKNSPKPIDVLPKDRESAAKPRGLWGHLLTQRGRQTHKPFSLAPYSQIRIILQNSLGLLYQRVLGIFLITTCSPTAQSQSSITCQWDATPFTVPFAFIISYPV